MFLYAVYILSYFLTEPLLCEERGCIFRDWDWQRCPGEGGWRVTYCSLTQVYDINAVKINMWILTSFWNWSDFIFKAQVEWTTHQITNPQSVHPSVQWYFWTLLVCPSRGRMVPSDLNEKIMLTKSQVGFCSGNVSFFFLQLHNPKDGKGASQ